MVTIRIFGIWWFLFIFFIKWQCWYKVLCLINFNHKNFFSIFLMERPYYTLNWGDKSMGHHTPPYRWKWNNYMWCHQILKRYFSRRQTVCLSFILTVNPLSFVLRNLKGYSYGANRNSNITHNFFVDDLKSYASNINILQK